MTVGLKGLLTPEGQTRDIAYLEVNHAGLDYDWQTYIPQGVNVAEYLTSIEDRIYEEIEEKEAEWFLLEPKTREIVDPITGEKKTVPILKEEIVRPDMNIPNVVSMRQARLALLQGNLLSTVDEMITTLPGIEGEVARIEWEYAQEVNIDSSLVKSIAAAIPLTYLQVRDLFKLAATL